MDDESELPEKKTNTYSLTGFILAIICFLCISTAIHWTEVNVNRFSAALLLTFPVLAIALSLLGKRFAKRNNQKKGFGKAGLVIGILSLLWGTIVYFSLDFIKQLDPVEWQEKIEQIDKIQEKNRDF